MPRRRTDPIALDEALRSLEHVATHAQLRQLGVSSASISRRISVRGPWQRALPGVVISHRGSATRRELLLAALAYAGPGAVISGVDALRALGAGHVPLHRHIDVLIPAARQRTSVDFVRIERTVRLPDPIIRAGVPYAGGARATIDTCRHTDRPSGTQGLVAEVVQERVVPVDALVEELLCASRPRTSAARAALLDVSSGVRSVAEARARGTFIRYGVPMPLWNVQLLDGDGNVLLTPDAFWPELGAVMEIDSLTWHLRPSSWRRTQQRQRLMTVHGLLVLSFAPQEILENPELFVGEIRAMLAQAARRPNPSGITCRPLR